MMLLLFKYQLCNDLNRLLILINSKAAHKCLTLVPHYTLTLYYIVDLKCLIIRYRNRIHPIFARNFYQRARIQRLRRQERRHRGRPSHYLCAR